MFRFFYIFLLVLFLKSNFILAAAKESSTASSKQSGDKSIGLAVGGGLPNLIYGEMSILRIKYVHFGFNYGALPLNTIVSSAVNMDEITAPRTIAENIVLTPIPSASIRSFSAFARVFPWTGAFYLQTAVMGLNLRGSVTASVSNENTGIQITSVSASLRLTIPMVSVGIGWQSFITDYVFTDIGLGAAFLTKAEKSFSLSGISLAAYDEALYSRIQTEQQNLSNQIDETLNNFINKVPVIPIFYISVGVAF